MENMGQGRSNGIEEEILDGMDKIWERIKRPKGMEIESAGE